MRRIGAVVALVLGAAACVPVAPVTVEPGDPVRIETPRVPERIEGTALEADAHRIVVRTVEDDTTALGAAEIERLEVNRSGARDAERVLGAVVFAGAGFFSTFGSVFCLSSEFNSGRGCHFWAGAVALTVQGGRLMTRSDWIPGLLPDTPVARATGDATPSRGDDR